MEINMKSLEDYLTSYKNITMSLIDSLDKEEFDETINLLELRQEIIENISKLDFKPNIFKQTASDLNLAALEDRAKKLLEQKHSSIKGNLERTRQNRRANSNYFKNNPSESIFFNKKI